MKRLNEQVRRNRGRFPDDFLLRLSAKEAAALRSQNATLKTGRGAHRKYLPYAFTEHGAIMAANVLNSPRAVEVGVYVDTHDDSIRQLIEAIRQLMAPPPEPKRRGRIGFGRENDA